MRQRVLPISTAALLLGLAGCSTVSPIAATVENPGMANAEVALQQSMGETGRELSRIGDMRPAAVASARPKVLPGELEREISFQWHGSLDDAVRELAKIVGYTVEIRNATIFTERVQVSIEPPPRRAYDLFRELGVQAGARAGVHVDPQHHSVEVVYHA